MIDQKELYKKVLARLNEKNIDDIADKMIEIMKLDKNNAKEAFNYNALKNKLKVFLTALSLLANSAAQGNALDVHKALQKISIGEVVSKFTPEGDKGYGKGTFYFELGKGRLKGIYSKHKDNKSSIYVKDVTDYSKIKDPTEARLLRQMMGKLSMEFEDKLGIGYLSK